MYIDQISVFVENKTGRLAGIMEVLNKAGIDIRERLLRIRRTSAYCV